MIPLNLEGFLTRISMLKLTYKRILNSKSIQSVTTVILQCLYDVLKGMCTAFT